MGITKYFKIKEDETIPNRPNVLGFKSIIKKAVNMEEEESILHVETTGKAIDYTDYLDRTLLLVSDEFREVAKMYHKDYIYKTAVLLEKGKMAQKVYWNIEMPKENTRLSSLTTFKRDGTLDRIIINEKKADGLAFFRLENKLWNTYIIRLDMVESLLRRSLVGFTLEEIEHE